MINILSCPAPYDKLEPLFRLIVEVIGIIKIGVPIILILYGMLDFGKAVVSKNEEEIKKSQMMFVKRAVYAVVIFFVITLVSLITNLVAQYTDDNTDVNAESWLDCLGLGGGSNKSTTKSNYIVNFKASEHGGLSGVGYYIVNSSTDFYANIIVPTPTQVANDGYTFEKWDPALPKKDTKVVKDITYTAVFSADENNNEIADVNEKYYTVKFNALENGKINGNNSFKVLTGLRFNNKIEVPEVIPNEGYTFTGWDIGLPGDDYVVTSDIEFNAIYKKNG